MLGGLKRGTGFGVWGGGGICCKCLAAKHGFEKLEKPKCTDSGSRYNGGGSFRGSKVRVGVRCRGSVVL